MSQSNNNADDPLFIMHIGATYAIRISVLHGSSHGLMALPVHGVVRVRMQGGRGNDAQEIEVPFHAFWADNEALTLGRKRPVRTRHTFGAGAREPLCVRMVVRLLPLSV